MSKRTLLSMDLGKLAIALYEQWDDEADYGSYERKCGRCDGSQAMAVPGTTDRDWCHECGGTGIKWDSGKMVRDKARWVGQKMLEHLMETGRLR